MTQAKQGDIVKLHYMGKLPDGTIFDTSVNAILCSSPSARDR